MRITDREVIDLLIARFPSPAQCAKTLDVVSLQSLYNWRLRGVPPGWRYFIWRQCRDRGVRISEEWCRAKRTRGERAAIEKALRLVKRASNGGATNGSKKTRQRQRPATQRRTTTGRSVPALAG